MRKPKITLAFEEHSKQAVVCLCFEKDSTLIWKVKALPNARWSQSRKFWDIPKEAFDLHTVFEVLNPFAYLDYSALKTKGAKPELNKNARRPKPNPTDKLSNTHQHELSEFRVWMQQQRYATNSIKIYQYCLANFFRFYPEKEIDEINNRDIEKFNHDFILKNGYSSKTQNQYISAIKTYYLKMKGTNHILAQLERPIEGQKLPKVLPVDLVQKMLECISNIKHKTALTTIYALGLRRSELLNIKLRDISFERDAVEIRNSKGKKDRVLPLPRSLKQLLTTYLRHFEPQIWLIEGQKPESQYSPTSLEKIFKKYLANVTINDAFSLHCLRHSYATHLLDMGVDLRIIQELLGHKSSRTTEIYTHVSMKNLKNVKNPLDQFGGIT